MNILKELKKIEDEIISWRRQLHENPELGLDLPKTSAFVANRLEEFGISFEKGVGVDHSVIGFIPGNKAEKTIAFRADMDALSIVEATGLSFASKNGCMHACGHDAHTAILLGAAKILNENRDRLKTNIVLIFQPSEEDSKGARPIANSGIFEKYKIEKIYGLHVGSLSSDGDLGKVLFNTGPMMACLDSFKIRVTGKGAHGAFPHMGVDPITIAAYIVTSIQEIISREVPATEPGVISIGKFQAGTAYNIIPNYVEIEGTARAVTEKQRQYISKRIGELARSIATGLRGSVDYDYTFGAPPLVNNKEVTLEAIASAKKLFPEEQVMVTNTPVMVGEDFAEYLEKVPGTFMFVETMLPIDGKIYPHHNPKFALDESRFIEAASLFVQIALDN